MSDEIADAAEAELPLETVGSRLRRAREAAGLSLAQVAAETKIGERQLAAIEDSNFAALPGRTYAVGFSRTYAKLVGLDESEVVAGVRSELADIDPVEQRRGVQTFEPGDPARVPSARLAWIAAALIAAVLVGALVVWPSIFAPGGKLRSILPDETAAPVAPPSQPAPAAAQPAPAGPVVFTALQPAVWVKFTDAAGNQLFQKELAQGESWTVPADKGEVFLRTAKPNALAISIGGQSVPKIAEEQKTVVDVPVSAAALLARGHQASGAASAPGPAGSPAASAAPARQPRSTATPRAQQRIEQPRVQASPAPAGLPAAAAPAPAPTASAPAASPGAN